MGECAPIASPHGDADLTDQSVSEHSSRPATKTDGEGDTKATPHAHTLGIAQTPITAVDEPLYTQHVITPTNAAPDLQNASSVSEEVKDLLCQALEHVMSCIHDDKETDQHQAEASRDKDTQHVHKISEDATLWERTKAYGLKKIGILSEKVKILKEKPWYPVAMFFGKIAGSLVSLIFLCI